MPVETITFIILNFPFELVVLMSVIYLGVKPNVQKMCHVIWGLIGMTLVNWIIIGCLLAYRFKFYSTIAHIILLIAINFFVVFYCLFWNHGTDLYIQLPHRSTNAILFFGITHLALPILFPVLYSPIFIVLLLSSYSFCVDAYSCIFTDHYMLCRHIGRYAENPRELRVRHYVAVRRVYKKELPEGFEFEDQVRI
uniref:XK-related protein n=1 Tax=Caenorhabditis tropicalis TaxID=1561998 RepID=A0A1I7TUT9_9PELO